MLGCESRPVMGILELQDVVVRYGTGRKSVVAVLIRISLTVETGKTLGIVGESGSGKSSLAKALVGLVPIESGQWNSAEWTTHPKRRENLLTFAGGYRWFFKIRIPL